MGHLRRGIRPDLTVWGAVEEALRWRTATGNDPIDPNWGDLDPLRGTLSRLLDHSTGPIAADVQIAVRRWVVATGADDAI
ncbi:MAG: hypothetical protein ACRD0G_11855 [Acidimicrobiales bacterium]